MIVGNLVAGKRIAQACGRDVAQLEDNDQARGVERFLISPTHHLPLSSCQPCGLNHDRHVCDIAASLFQLGDNKTCVFLPFSSCIYKTCCSGEHRPLQIILYLLFLMLRYCLLFQEVAEIMANLIPSFI